MLSEVDIGLTACTESVIAAVPCEIEDNMNGDLRLKEAFLGSSFRARRVSDN